ncbi:3-oxoacyl-[acyl-carrier-protein] synthase-1 [Treponema rectale]|uniref:3-oxoacyl-[acyl-carrier-protein] synthase-1 n=2 Tax=Treponema rectale TaxID=744512 RepID=A0A840S7Z7_9SPIR|nr:beta-ketoacyl synthase N-terminal-like domain-containing protein [Treponema rectale]MBB5217777.1 3-oxoacyl-[acyl-carrier-protein] synthase-1 [Treponema rectale]
MSLLEQMMNKVYLSAPALICSAGNDADEFWKRIVSGNRDGIKETETCTGKKFYAARIEESFLPEKASRFNMKIMRIEDAALEQLRGSVKKAMERYGTERTGVCVGSCDNGSEFSVAAHRVFFKDGKFPEDYSLEMQGADYVATYVKEKFGAEGPCLAFSTACSSSAGAAVKAAQLIKSGICDAVICGGVDIASDTVLLGFDSLEAVSSERTNPFSKNRSGITLGDGAAFFVMSRDNIFEDGMGIYLAGYGESADAYHMTSPDPSGEGAFISMKAALENAGLEEKDIGYVNLHGTGTKFNDSMEGKAVDKVFNGRKVLCSSTKSITGHTLGAAGSLELAACYMTLKNNSGKKNCILPCQVWDGERDEDIPELNFVTAGKEYVFDDEIKFCMSNSFAFGGSNVTLIIGRE